MNDKDYKNMTLLEQLAVYGSLSFIVILTLIIVDWIRFERKIKNMEM